MRFPKLPLLAAAVSVLCIVPAYAALDDPLYKFLANDGTLNDQLGYSVAISGTRAIVGARHDGYNGSLSGSAYLIDVASGLQLFKLLPDDGDQGDGFGSSIAMSGTRAIIGAPGNGDNGDASGSAYIFDTTSGGQLFKLLPTDGATGDNFGFSVAISGITAIVGAFQDGISGNGAAYLFDATTGLQTAKLLASDGAASDKFGNAVGISVFTAIVGAPFDDDNGSRSGSAYLFDITTGLQIGAKLLPTDGAVFDEFGTSVAISGTRAIVGARFDGDNDPSSGSAYIFDITTGLQLFKLLPDDGSSGDRFGQSVAINGTTAIVGAYKEGENGFNAGAAYLFDITTGLQIAKILPADGEGNDNFGWSVAISDVTTIIGAYREDDNGSNAGAAYINATDTDRDGLLDSWENNGIPYFDGGSTLQHYMLPGADPNHKDLYVEVDSMIGLGFNATAQANVITAFANTPNALVNNPDGLDGITLHLTIDETNIPITPFPNNWVNFDPLKAARFGTPPPLGERADPDWFGPGMSSGPRREAKLKAFRYCIFGQSHGTTSSSGLAEFPGNDFMVTLGLWTTPGGTVNQQAGTFMHELGHTLDLGHGGGDDRNRKPNYYSVMSYTWQYPKTVYAAFWRLDYSHVKLAPLDESALVESDGIDGSDPDFAAIQSLFGIGGEPPVKTWAKPNGTPVDWNKSGGIDPGTVAVDLNYLFQCRPPGGGPRVPCPTPGQVLVGHADWLNLRYAMFGASFADGVHDVTTLDTEMTLDIFDQMDAILPPVVCLADTNGDSMVNVTDLLTLLGGWGPNPGHPADINGDDQVNVTDLLALLGAWGACP